MILTAHQVAYLPWLGYFSKIQAADVFVLLDTAQHETGSFENRNRIMTGTGEQWLTVPVHSAGHIGKPVHTLAVANEHRWRRKHWTALRQAYGKAPHWPEVESWLGPYYDKLYGLREWIEGETLPSLCVPMLRDHLRALGIERDILFASDLKISSSGSDFLVDLCERLGADSFLFGGKGRAYVDREAFKRAGIKPLFQTALSERPPHLAAVHYLAKHGAKFTRGMLSDWGVSYE